jgi:hypothetical protein
MVTVLKKQFCAKTAVRHLGVGIFKHFVGAKIHTWL